MEGRLIKGEFNALPYLWLKVVKINIFQNQNQSSNQSLQPMCIYLRQHPRISLSKTFVCLVIKNLFLITNRVLLTINIQLQSSLIDFYWSINPVMNFSKRFAHKSFLQIWRGMKCLVVTVRSCKNYHLFIQTKIVWKLFRNEAALWKLNIFNLLGQK